MKALVLALLAACADQPSAPTIELVPEADAPLDAHIAQGAFAWHAIGFELGASDLPDCRRDWYEAPVDDACAIRIRVAIVDHLAETHGTNALADRDMREIAFDSRLAGLDLQLAAAHETGHVVLDTSLHTVGGVMGGSDWVLHDVDYALACETIHICKEAP